METTISIRSVPILPTSVMHHINFDQVWPPGLEIHVFKFFDAQWLLTPKPTVRTGLKSNSSDILFFLIIKK